MSFAQQISYGCAVAGGVFMLNAAIITLFVPYTRVIPEHLQKIIEREAVVPTVTPPEAPVPSE